MKNFGENTDKVMSQTGNMPIQPIGTKKMCGKCPSGCKTICSRGNLYDYDVKDKDFEGFEVKFEVPDYGTFKKKKKKED